MNMHMDRLLGYERVYLPLGKVADTPFHIQGDDMYILTVYLLSYLIYFFTYLKLCLATAIPEFNLLKISTHLFPSNNDLIR